MESASTSFESQLRKNHFIHRWINGFLVQLSSKFFPILILLLAAFRGQPLVFEFLIFVMLMAAHLEVPYFMHEITNIPEEPNYLQIQLNKTGDKEASSSKLDEINIQQDFAGGCGAKWHTHEQVALYTKIYARPNSKFYIAAAFLIALFRELPIVFHILIGVILAMSCIELPAFPCESHTNEEQYNILLNHLSNTKGNDMDLENARQLDGITSMNAVSCNSEDGIEEDQEEDSDSDEWDKCDELNML